MEPDPDALDVTLLNGFTFGCRPDCGLCCYATPAVTPTESAALLRIEPSLNLVPTGGAFHRISDRPDGGACQLLRTQRCRAHAARPYPCRTYPLSIHVGTRAVVSLVLSCPGVGLGPLVRIGSGTTTSAGPEGLGPELRSAEAEARRAPLGAWRAAHARAEARVWRKLARRGSKEDPRAVVAELAARPPGPAPGWSEGFSVPPADAALEELPLFFDPRFGRVAIRSGPADGTWELLALREAGGIEERIGTFAVPEGPWHLEADAGWLLAGYQRYLLARDHLVWSTYLELDSGAEESFEARLRDHLVDAATEVLRRASVRALATGQPSGTLGVTEVEEGIRATDAEMLDRPTLGRIL